MPDDTRPTFGQALEAAEAASGGDTPATPASDAPGATGVSSAPPQDPGAPATAATQPVSGDGSTPTPVEEWDSAAGPIPVDRHKAILENTRARATQEAQTAIQQQYGWALQLGPERVQALNNLGQQLATEPVGFIINALEELSANPEYAPQLRSHVAKVLARRPGGLQPQAAPADDAEPPPDIVVDGYAWYSAKQLAARDQWREQRLLHSLHAELAPLREDMNARQERDQIIAATQAANNFATTTLAEMHKLPYFKEQKAEIEKVFRAMPPMPDAQVGQAIREAYIQVLVNKVLPSLTNTAKSNLLSSLNQKAAASARNPSAGSVATNARPKTFEEALRQAESANAR